MIRRFLLMTSLCVCLAVLTGCGIFDEVVAVSNHDAPPEAAETPRTPRLPMRPETPDLSGLEARAESTVQAGRFAEAERLLRAARSEGRINERLMVLLAEAVLLQGDAKTFNQEFSAMGRRAAFLSSGRVRSAAAKALTQGDSADRMIMLDTLTRSMARIPRDQAPGILLPFVVPLSKLVDGDDRALAVVALDVLTALPLPEARRKLEAVANGPDPVLSRLAAGAVPQRR